MKKVFNVLKVATKSHPNSVDGAIAVIIREKGYAGLQVIGTEALNQAVKAIAISKGVAFSGINFICIPAFLDIEIDWEERTAIRFIIETN